MSPRLRPPNEPALRAPVDDQVALRSDALSDTSPTKGLKKKKQIKFKSTTGSTYPLPFDRYVKWEVSITRYYLER